MTRLVCLSAMALMLWACASSPDRPANAVKSESPTLVRALRQELRGAMGDAASDSVEATLEAMRGQFAEALLATELEEGAMRLGRLDDRSNLRQLERLLTEAQRQEMSINTVLRRLLNELQSEGLAGVRLELAVRLLGAQLRATAVQNLQRDF